MGMRRILASVLVLGWCVAGGPARAGVVIEQEQREPGSDTPGARTVYYFEGTRLRIETQSEAGEMIVLFQAEKSLAWIIDREAGTYAELTPAKVAELRQKIEEARREMAAQLAELPAEQREAMERLLGPQVAAPKPLTVRVLGRGEAVGSFVCTHYEVLSENKRKAEVWAAGPEQLQLDPKEYETFAALDRLLAPLGSGGPLGALGGLSALPSGGEKVEGFAVRSLTYANGQPVAEERVLKAERRALEPSLFSLPSGLRKTELGAEE